MAPQKLTSTRRHSFGDRKLGGPIEITYYVNPHEFWFRYVEKGLSIEDETIEERIQRLGNDKKHYNHEPSIGDIVIVQCLFMGKYIRARVDYELKYAAGSEFILWAIDDGFPIKSNKKLIARLASDDLKGENPSVFKATLNQVIPATPEYDFLQLKSVMAKRVSWSEKAINEFEKIYLNGTSLIFHYDCNAAEQHVYGSLEVILNNGKVVNMNEVLKNIDEAIEAKDFEKEYQNLVHKDYWLRQGKILENVHDCQSKVKALKPKNTRDINTVDKVNDWYQHNTRLASNTNSSKTNESNSYGTVPLNKRYDHYSKPDPSTPSTSGTTKILNTKTENVANRPSGSSSQIVKETPKPSGSAFNNDRQPKIEMPKNHFKKVLIKESFSTRQPNRVLAHCRIGLMAESVSSIAEVNFTDSVHQNLENKRITDVLRVQAVAWPHLLRNHSLIVINAAKTGKTWTYLPAICSLAMEHEKVREEGGDGPVAMIICLDSGAVDTVQKNCVDLSKGSAVTVESFSLHDAENIQECKMLNGMDILVTSIPCLLRLMESPLRLFNTKRLARVVFDEIDSMYQRFGKEKIQKIYHTFCTAEKQFIVTSKTWHRSLKQFCEKDDLLLCIGAYIEAAIYSNIDMTVQSTNENNRFKQFLDYFQKRNHADEQTVIVCDKSEEVLTIKTNLRSEGYARLTYCHDKTDSAKIDSINQQIIHNNTSTLGVLICTDDTLADLHIRNAQHIIHYSLPYNWTTFTQRYVASFDYYVNMVGDGISSSQPTSVVFVDGQSSDSMPRLVEFMKSRCFANVPDSVLQFAEQKRIEREEKNTKHAAFCKSLILFGVCDTQYTCRCRHILIKSDRLDTRLPRSGQIKFDIVSVHSPAHFTIRILEHRSLERNEWRKMSSVDVFGFEIELQKYFSDTQNRISQHSPKVGDLCVIDEGDDIEIFRRCKIIGIDEKSKEKMLLLIDTNTTTKWLKSQDLFELPDKFKDCPPQAVDIRIAGVVPLDLGAIWDTKLTSIVRKWCDPGKNCHFRATIEMGLMNCLWVTSIEMIEKLPSIGGELEKFNFKKEIIRRNLGQINENSLTLLRDMALKAGILSAEPTVRQPSPVLPLKTEPETHQFTHVLRMANNQERGRGRGRFLTNSSNDIARSPTNMQSPMLNSSTLSQSPEKASATILIESENLWEALTPGTFNEVDIGEFYSPDQIYVLLASKFPRFDQLRKRINKFTRNSTNLKPLSQFEVGRFCLALAENTDEYKRVQILNVYESEVRLFWLDYGVQESFVPENFDLIEIPKELITFLPFQAILCKMVGIRPFNDSGEWNDDECSNIYQTLTNQNSSIFVRCAENYSVSNDIIKCNSYEAVYFDKKSEQIINRLVVQNEFADYDLETEHAIDVDVEWNLLQLADSTDEDVEENHYEQLMQLLGDEDCDVQMGDFLEELMKNQSPHQQQTVPNELEKVVSTKPNPMPKAIVENNDAGFTATRTKLMKNVATQLSSPAKIPHINWKQNESTISMNVSAPDVTGYSLKVGSRFVHICFVVNNERYEEILNLFGCIDAKYTTHEVRGLNISIKLKKTMASKHWPRLQKSSDKSHFIRCTEYDDDSDENVETYESRFAPRGSDSDKSSSDDDDHVNINEYEL